MGKKITEMEFLHHSAMRCYFSKILGKNLWMTITKITSKNNPRDTNIKLEFKSDFMSN